MNQLAAPLVVVAVDPALHETFFGRGQLDRLREVATVRLAADHRVLDAHELADARAVITGWGSGRLTPDLLAAAPQLTALVHSAGSLRQVLDPACYQASEQFIATCQADANAEPVVDFTVAMVVLSLKNAFTLRERYRQNRGAPAATREGLADGVPFRRVGIVGASRIGRGVMERLRSFEVELGLFDPFVSPDEATALGARSFADLVELARWSEVFSVHAPWLPATEGMISDEVLAALPDGCHLINTARGALIDESALIAQLETGRIDAVLDVTWPEPPAPESPLWTLPNVFITPHLAGSMGTEFGLLGRGAIDEAIRVLTGQPLRFPIDAQAYARQA